MIVVDASIALAWALQEREHAHVTAALQRAAEQGGFVPGNFQTEVAHALLQAERKKRLTAADVAEALGYILDLPLAVQMPSPYSVVAIAREYGLAGYDAAYLALAIQSQLPLATIDPSLAAAAKAAKCAWKPKG